MMLPLRYSVYIGVIIIIAITDIFLVGYIWGIIVAKVMRKKGYIENWFWAGFFLRLIAIIIALSKPSLIDQSHKNYPTNPHIREKEIVEEIRSYKQLLDEGIITEEEFERKKESLLK
ncbi:MAG: SHOCT domain-containing protein [Firmicutes bacterium]|nr:SHOCT domain-containing protein [Bacillota bacterium]